VAGLISSTLRIGDLAPPLVLPDLYGGVVALGGILEQKPAVVVFAPGSWSPGMRRQLAELDDECERLRAAGVELLMVVSQDLPRLRRALGSRRPRFPVLADERRGVARDYGVYRAVSMDGIGVTSPAVFLIDRANVIRFVYVGRGSDDLPDTHSLVRLAAWLVRAEEIEATRSSYPVDGEIWLDEHTSIERPDGESTSNGATAVVPTPAPRRRRARRTPPPGPTAEAPPPEAPAAADPSTEKPQPTDRSGEETPS
jgi:peroxiredoxin